MRFTENYQKFFLLGSIVIIFGLVIWVRLRLLGLPLERDEGEYAYISQQIIQGVLPYADSQSMKFPGIFFIYAGILIILGESLSAIHFSVVIVNFATAYFIFLLGKNLFNKHVGIFSAVYFSVFTLSVDLQGLWANAEHFVLLPGVVGLYVLYIAKDRTSHFFLSGILLGTALLIKQHAVFFCLFGILNIGFLVFWKLLPFQKLFKHLASFVFGILAPLIASAALYGATGNILKLWFC